MHQQRCLRESPNWGRGRNGAGGISPLALINSGLQTVIDQSAREHGEIHVSGGQRGLNIRLPIRDLVKLTSARLADIRRS